MGYDLRMRALALFVLPLLAAAVAAQTKDAGPVIGMNNWIHATANLDKTVQFYIDVFGLDKPAPPRPPNPAVPALLNVPGAKLRVQILRFPGAPFGFELTHFGNEIELHPNRPEPGDAGTAGLIVRVRDYEPVLAGLKKAGAPNIPASKSFLLTQDPDGYFIRVEPGDPGAAMELKVADMHDTLKFYHDLLGFDVRVSGERNMSATVPGTKAEIYFEKGFGPVTRHRVPDPGTPAIALRVSDLDGLLGKLKAAGTPVISAGGVPAQFSPTIRNIFVEDPSGFKIELYEQK
jgi:catechol 2,3-dioxygenase-like lactoylglutathione lyase family enzyme